MISIAKLKQSDEACRALEHMNKERNVFEFPRCHINKICTSISCVRKQEMFDFNVKYILEPCSKPFGVVVVISLKPPQYVTSSTNISTQFGTLSVDIEPTNNPGIMLGVCSNSVQVM